MCVQKQIAELGGGRRGLISGRKIVEGVIFVLNNNLLLLTTGLIFLTLSLITCSKLNKNGCMVIIRKQNCAEGYLILGP
jgi:hypothetical protein